MGSSYPTFKLKVFIPRFSVRSTSAAVRNAMKQTEKTKKRCRPVQNRGSGFDNGSTTTTTTYSADPGLGVAVDIGKP